MSEFRKNMQAVMSGIISLESQVIEPQNVSSEFTADEVRELREERDSLQVVEEHVDSIEKDVDYISNNVIAASTVNNIAKVIKDTDPCDGVVVVDIANQQLKDVESTTGITPPKLETNPNGKVSEASLESFTGWIKTAASAFASSVDNFTSRIGMAWRRLDHTSEGVSRRIHYVRHNLQRRKNLSGGNKLDISVSQKLALIKENGLSTNPAADLNDLLIVVAKATDILNNYVSRLSQSITSSLHEVIIDSNKVPEFFTVESGDLGKELDALYATQPKVLFGNYRLKLVDRKTSPALKYELEIADGYDPKQIVKHLDNPVSLSNEAILDLLDKVQVMSTNHIKHLNMVEDHCVKAMDNYKITINKLRRSVNDVDDEDFLESSFDDSALLRIENYLLAELGRAVLRIQQYNLVAANATSAVVALAEESIFQD